MALTRPQAAILSARHVAAFNEAVEDHNFDQFLELLTDEAVIRFENVPGAGELTFAGRDAYTRAYQDQPPDDQIDVTSPAEADGNDVVLKFAWRRTADAGTMRLTYVDGVPDALDTWLVKAMTVTFA